MLHVVVARTIIESGIGIVLQSASLRRGAVEIVKSVAVAVSRQEIESVEAPLCQSNLQGVEVRKPDVFGLIQETYIRKLVIERLQWRVIGFKHITVVVDRGAYEASSGTGCGALGQRAEPSR